MIETTAANPVSRVGIYPHYTHSDRLSISVINEGVETFCGYTPAPGSNLVIYYVDCSDMVADHVKIASIALRGTLKLKKVAILSETQYPSTSPVSEIGELSFSNPVWADPGWPSINYYISTGTTINWDLPSIQTTPYKCPAGTTWDIVDSLTE